MNRFVLPEFATARRWAAGVAIAILGMTVNGGAARAEMLIGLTTDNNILSINSSSPESAGPLMAVNGLVVGDSLIGIDTRSLDGQIYGVSVGTGGIGRIYTIDASTGNASLFSTLTAAPGDSFTNLTGLNFGVDFNPTVDRLRVVSITGENYRINVDTGAVITDTPLNPGSPQVVAVAYTNPDNDPTTGTQLYDINVRDDTLNEQFPANSGVLTINGELMAGFDVGEFAGFDISPSGVGYASLTPVGGGNSSLFQIDLDTGFATNLGMINGGVTLRGLTTTAIPEPASLAMMGLGGASLLGYLKRRTRRNTAV